MGIFASLFAFIGRFLGRALSMAMGWATILLFGRVPQSKQLLLSLISLGSLAWFAALLGVLIPSVGALLVSFAPIPDSLAEQRFFGIEIDTWVRIAMLVAALVIPLLVGIGSYFMMATGDRPTGAGVVKQVLRGYPYAAVLALSMAFMIVIAPARKLRSMTKRWSDAHIPVVVKPGGYDVVADDLERALDTAGLEIERVRAPRVLEAPSKLLAAVAGPGVKRLVPDELIQLRNRNLEVLIYPSDISIVGKPDQLAHARAAVASRLTFTAAYMTTSEEAQKIEDRLERIWSSVPAVKTAAQALNPANASQEPGGGRAAAAEAVDRARDGSDEGEADAASAARTARATAASAGSPAAAEDEAPGSGSSDATAIADSLPPQATRDELLAAGYVAPSEVADPEDGMDPETIDGLVHELKEIDLGLAVLVIPHEEWEVLYRLRLQVERDLLVTRDVIEGRVDGEERPASGGLPTTLVRGVAGTAATLQRALGGTPIGRVAGLVRQALPEPPARKGDGSDVGRADPETPPDTAATGHMETSASRRGP
jgi:hypothetical protein